jgi:hypothetical protein
MQQPTAYTPPSPSPSPAPPYFVVRAQVLEGSHLLDAPGAPEQVWRWADLAALYAPANSTARQVAQRILRQLGRGDFLVGLRVAGVAHPLPLVLKTSRDVSKLLRQDPSWPERATAYHRVLDINWGATISIHAPR